MAAQKKPVLTDAELEIMNVLWDQGPSRVRAIVDALPAARPTPPSSPCWGSWRRRGTSGTPWTDRPTSGTRR